MDKRPFNFILKAGLSAVVTLLALGQSSLAADTAVPATASATEESDLSQLTKPKSTVEAGVGGVTDNNWKFGQYNGLNFNGPYGIGNFDIRGGGAYDSGDATRWRITGKNIGLETREFTGEYGSQGTYKLKFGYDEILRYGQGSYQTPYLGVGGNNLSLPGNWAYPTTANNMRTLPLSDNALFRNEDLSTKRQRYDGGISYFLTPEWEAKVSYRHEDKNGIKALGAPIVAARAVILPEPISQSTEQINASMNFTGEKAFGQFSYYGSLFHNDYNGITFQNAFAPASASNPGLGRMSTAPDNQFHQFNINGGYNFSPDTKLVGTGSYGRNWQDESFLPYNTLSTTAGLPRSSLGGDVETSAASLKLTHKSTKDLNFAAAYKYDERNDHTPISLYSFVDVDAIQVGGSPQSSVRTNTPYSKRLQQGNLDANYSFAQGHWMKAGYEIQNIDRWCNGSWISCVDTGTTTENTGRIDYRGSFFDKVNAKLGYAYSHRSADSYNQDNAFWSSFGSPQAIALYNQIAATGLPAWGPGLGFPKGGVAYPFPSVFPNNNTGQLAGSPLGPQGPIDIAGLGRYNTSARDRQRVNSLLDYQVTDKLSIGVSGDYRYDSYPQSTYGQQSSRNWSINLDTNYAFNEDLSAHVFYTYQDIKSKTAGASYGTNSDTGSNTAGSVSGGCYNSVLLRNNNAKIDPCLNWLSDMNDNIDTVGFGLKHKGLFSGRLYLSGDFFYSFARTAIDVTGGQYVQSPTGNAANGPFYYINATPMPDVKSETIQFKLDAKYSFNKSSAAHFTYLYQHLVSSDYIYTGMNSQGTPQGVMPTNESAPRYSVHAIGLSYIYSF